ncbi:hypothetical protein G9A89_006380 [Geosiphon pyriformis]|nr:hypothetical protein G9A89_006380 [Geosiphon pyriformis]
MNCQDFKIVSPEGSETFQRGQPIKVYYEKNDSLINAIDSVELYYEHGWVADLRVGSEKVPFDGHGEASLVTTLTIPNTVDWVTYGNDDTATKFTLKSWGSSAEGPNCITFR